MQDPQPSALDRGQLALAVDAYIWGFPRMLYEKYLGDFRESSAPFNRFLVMDRMATPNHGGVNVDTLYGVAWLDLVAEPVVMEAPDADGRYYSVQMVDVHANNFAYVGRRTTGTKFQRCLIAGPQWRGDTPAGMLLIRSPSRRVFCFLRTLIDDETDVAVANAFHERLAWAPLSAYPRGLLGSVLLADLGPYFPHRHSHLDKLGAAYYDRLGDALASDPPTRPQDLEAMNRFATIGVGPGRHPAEQSPACAELLAEAANLGHERVFAATPNTARNGWSINLNFDAGDKDPLFKAAVNRYGIGMVGAEEAIYLLPAALSLRSGDPVPPWTSMDPDGGPLTGARNYRLRFAPAQLPKTDAFWSLTMYDDDLMLVENPIGRYAIGDRTRGLVYGADGSLELLIQHQCPASGISNWLPAPKGEFQMIFRAYQPQASFLNGEYQLPPLEVADDSTSRPARGAHEPLSVDLLLERARKETGLASYGTRDFIPSLRKLVESVNGDLRQLHEKGRAGIEDRIIRLLVNRLRMQRDVEKHPEILSEQLLPPAVIIGLPRTGSTKLQRMLAAGHGFHELLMWQAFNPAPFPGADRGTRDPRIQAAADFVAWVARDAPDSHKGHMMIVEGTEEENHLLEQTFDTPTTVSFVPAYSWCKYIERVDKTASYAHLRTCLQYLQWQFHGDTAKPWLLKYPANLGNESYISRTFPGARYVVTHRDPLPIMASLSRYGASTQLLYCHAQSIRQFARWALEEFSSEMERHLAWREANPDAEVLDISFREIVDNGFEVARRIYAFLGVAWTPETQAEIRDWLVENERQKDKLEYSFEDVGISKEECSARFADYCRRFSGLF